VKNELRSNQTLLGLDKLLEAQSVRAHGSAAKDGAVRNLVPINRAARGLSL